MSTHRFVHEFIETLFIKALNRKKPKMSITGEENNKLRQIHAIGQYLTIERNKLLMHATNTNESQNRYAEQKILDTKEDILYNFHLYKNC